MNLMMLLEMSAQGFGDRTAFIHGDDSLSYQELFTAAGRAAERLRDENVAHMGMLDISSLALPIALFAAAWAGRPFVPVNYRLAEDDIEALLTRIVPAEVIVDSAITTAVEGVQAIDRDRFIKMARDGGPQPEHNWTMDPEDVAVLLFTSGTTGAPKAAMLRHRHLASYILSSIEFGSALGEKALVCVPPYHIAGVSSVVSSVYAGRTVVQMPNFDAETWVDLVQRHEISTAFLVPTMLRQIVAVLEQRGEPELSSLRSISYGGGKMPQAVIRRAMELLPDSRFTQAYGLTETSSTICVLLPEQHREALVSEDPAVRRRLSSLGHPLPGIELQIRDSEGNVLAPGERGEIFVRGEQVSGEYVGKGSLLDAQGWFATRDAGELDAAGFLYLEGRQDDVIVRGAENMSPGEIEDVLLKHESVADVAVVGVPDDHWGEAVAAVVVLHADAAVTVQELQAWVRQHLRSSKVPSQIFFDAALPYNETGKLLRRVVRQQLAEAG
ncbi:MAG: class I adenylate-forming enzyme family protein [Pseudomonadota bacterium]